jgi:DNA invertase Pin-like site-specific DNA recombinase
MKFVGDPCPYCKRPLTNDFVERRRISKIENALASSAKREANGNGRGGRKKQRNDDEIKRLRASGMTFREIAKAVGFSTTAVQRALKTGVLK